jgi:hypothetical protein
MLLLIVSLVASVVAQSSISGAVAAGSSVAWESVTTWGGAVPSGTADVSITADVTVTVSSAKTFITGTTLTLGAIGTAGTQLILNNTGTFTAYTFAWANGHLVLQGNSNFACVFGATLAGGVGVQDRQLVGGSFTLGNSITGGALITVAVTGGSVAFSGTNLNAQAGTIAVSSGAVVNFSTGVATNVTSDVSFNGGGNVSIQGEVVNNATINIGTTGTLGGNNPSVTWVWGNFTLTASGKATVAAGSSLVVAAGGRLKRTSASATAAINVAATGTVQFAAGTTSWIDSNIQASGNVVVDAGATTTVSQSSSFTGTGSLDISGTFIASAAINAAATANTAISTTVHSGGTLQIDGGNAVTLGATTFNSGSSLKLAFATANNVGTFAAVTVQGALALGGTLYVDVPVQPKATVTLVTATSISGFVSGNVVLTANGAVGRRLLGSSSGSVQQSGNSLTYTPPATGAASTVACSVMLPLLGLALW